MITIDGSKGEGGGQMLRSSLALSLVTGKPFTLENVRAKRSRPGLMRQHLTAVNAAAEVGQAETEGAELRSSRLMFKPGKIKAGEYHFAVGTAGSATLVLQTVLPALLTADGPSKLTLEGGTHNPFAPPFDFLEKAYLPQINRMGPRVSIQLERHGFYPAGGGKFVVEIKPAEKLKPFELLTRSEGKKKRARAIVANLPKHIAERELNRVRDCLRWKNNALKVEEVSECNGPGNIVILEIESDNVTEVFAGFGEAGKKAEKVANQAIDQARKYLAAEVPVGEYLADQLMLPLALAGGGAFLTLNLSQHSQTHIDVIGMFLDSVWFEVEKLTDKTVLVRIHPSESNEV